MDDDKAPSSLILLTYKSKALLMYKQKNPLDLEQHAWTFIGGTKGTRDSFEHTLQKSVAREMGIKIEKVEFVSDACYHATLTDDNVNQIKRAEGQLLAFFSLHELQNLSLSNSTREFVSKHGSLIKQEPVS